MGLKCMHLRNVETSVEISDETSFFLRKLRIYVNIWGVLDQNFQKRWLRGGIK